ncbi:hypothetical protein ES288_A03G108400v1 [Gossypium darwinii]|uniref:Uncharacterized protein n=1 Tax=Gossypium darwinii TaxID=34276 RepID=A0A5D2H5A3_GOSDA|nr:hypothetical protein ES288_A03G108400v1 [Gossypium darwinii]
MREAWRSISFKYTTWILAMQWSWAFMRIRMNHLFHGGKSLPARQEDSKNLSKFWGLKGSWKHIRTLEWNWKRDVTLVPSEMVRSLAQEEGANPYHLDLILISLFF